MKYIRYLAEYIQKEFKLFTINTIDGTTLKGIITKAKSQKTDDKYVHKSGPKKNKGKQVASPTSKKTTTIIVRRVVHPREVLDTPP